MSDTVKLIIEISKAIYEDLKLGKIYSSLCEAPQGLIEGIRNGIPLDDVKAEIKRMEYHMIDCDVLVCQEEVLEILNNIGKTESEGE